MNHLVASRTRVPGRLCYCAAVAVLAIAAAGCGSSSKVVNGTGSAGRSAAASAGPGGSASPGTPSPTASVRTVALPPPCTLLTPADVAPLFGTTDLSMSTASRPAGVAQCSFNLKVGIQAKQVSIVTRKDFGDDQSCIFPNGDGLTPVTGLGYPAVVRSTDNHGSRSANRSGLTVKLGKNVLEIDVEWYTDPVNSAFLTKLAKAALARV